DARLDRVHTLEGARRVRLGDRHREAECRAAVVLADDDVLGHVDQTTGEVPGVGGPQRGVRQTLTGAVRRGEVLEDGQALAVVRLDRPRDDLALRVGDQTTHTGDLAHLVPVTTGTGGHHPEDVVVRREVLPHDLVDLVGRLGPDVDELGAALLLTAATEVVLALDL